MQSQLTPRYILGSTLYTLGVTSVLVWGFAAVRTLLSPSELDRFFRANALFVKSLVSIVDHVGIYLKVFFEDEITQAFAEAILTPFQLFPLFWGALLCAIVSAVGLSKLAKAK